MTSISGETVDLKDLPEDELESLASQISAIKGGEKKGFKKNKNKNFQGGNRKNTQGASHTAQNKFPTGVNEKGERCCFKCGGTTHIAMNCHVGPKVNAVEEAPAEPTSGSGIFNLFY